MNAAEEAVVEELLPSEVLFAIVLLKLDNDTAATFFFLFTPAINLVMDIFVPK